MSPCYIRWIPWYPKIPFLIIMIPMENLTIFGVHPMSSVTPKGEDCSPAFPALFWCIKLGYSKGKGGIMFQSFSVLRSRLNLAGYVRSLTRISHIYIYTHTCVKIANGDKVDFPASHVWWHQTVCHCSFEKGSNHCQNCPALLDIGWFFSKNGR